MPIFEYKGLDTSGKNVKGKIDGESQKVARAKLKKQGIFPTEVIEKSTEEKKGAGLNLNINQFFNRIKLKDISAMTRQMATLIKANVPIVDSLAAIADQSENEKLKLILTNIKEQVNEGASLAAALGKYPDVFSNLYVNMVKAGETAGTLDTVLLRLADFTESSVKLKNKVMGAMTYPIVMIVVGVLVVSGLLTFVVPKITAVFEDMERALPLITQIVVGISHFMVQRWYYLIGGIFLTVYLFKKIISTEAGRQKFDRFCLVVPLFGRLVRMVSISRFASTLSTLLHGGVPLLAAMDIVKNVVDNRIIRDVISKARDHISEGQPLAAPLKESGEFPAIVTHMISIGEKTGELEAMLNNIADSYSNEVDTTVSSLTQVLEPLMILVMGVTVGIIVLAILLPILDLNKMAA